MKNELIKLENDYEIDYHVQVDSKNRRLNLFSPDDKERLEFEGYFRKGDVLNLESLHKIHLYNNGILETYDVYSFNSIKIGCCTIPDKVLKSIQDKFKKMK